MSSYSDRIVNLEDMCASLKNSNKLLADTVDDLENRLRRYNLRAVNLPEKIEGTNPVKFMSGFFAEVLGSDLFPSTPIQDWVHRLGPPCSGANSRPSAMIVKFHYYQDKEHALRVSRDKLIYHGDRVTFYSDYSISVNKKQAAFNPVKTVLY